MNLLDVAGRRRQPRADGPDWLVGDHDTVPAPVRWHGGLELAADHILGSSSLALALGLANADDRYQSRSQRGQCLLLYHAIAFAVVGTTLGVTDDDILGACVRQHGRRHVAGMSARGSRMAVLAAGDDAARRGDGGEL